MEIVINKCYGGFGLSNLAIQEYLKRKRKKAYFYKEDKNKFIKLKNLNEETWTVYVFTKNLGESFSEWPKNDSSYIYDREIKRDDPDLVKVVKQLGDKANGRYAELRVIKIPDGVLWEISDYDGMESVGEKHNSWS
jgi:hypothetical protein